MTTTTGYGLLRFLVLVLGSIGDGSMHAETIVQVLLACQVRLSSDGDDLLDYRAGRHCDEIE